MKKEVTYEEYLEACTTVRQYEYQLKPKTVQVTVSYDANLSITVRVPVEWGIDKIRKELEDGYYSFTKDDEENVELIRINDLIIGGEEINLKTNKIK